jgi:hypothetical protein
MQRIFLSDNGVLTDYTIEARSAATIPAVLVTGEDYIYIGTWDPINSFFIEMGSVVNTNASVMSLEYWSNSDWEEAVDLLDYTKSSGKTLAQTGLVKFIPDRDKLISRVDDTTSSDSTPTELNDIEIYDRYWHRLTVDATLSAGTVIKTIFYRFADTTKLNSLDPVIQNYLDSWESGKDNWDEQLMLASEEVVSDLKKRKVIRGSEELIKIDELELPTAYKALEMIYAGLGGKTELEKSEKNRKNYLNVSANINFTIDIDNNARVTPAEREVIQGRLVR